MASLTLPRRSSRQLRHRHPKRSDLKRIMVTAAVCACLTVGVGVIVYASTDSRRLVPLALGGLMGIALMSLLFLRFKSRFTVAWFLGFMALIILFNRQFAHIALPRPPLYVTETTMAVVTLLLASQGNLSIPRSMRKWLVWLAVVMAVGIAFNGVRFGWFPVLRDSAELYYVWMVPLSYSVLRLLGPYIQRVHVEWGLAIAAWIVPLVYFVTRSSQLPADSETICGMLIVAVLVWDWRNIPGLWIWPSVALQFIMVLHWGARGPWVGLGFGIMVLLWLIRDTDSNLKSRVLTRCGMVLGLALWGGLVLWTIDPALLTHIAHDISSLTTTHGSYSQVANNRWRLIIWTEALRQFMTNPLAIRVGQAWVPVQLIALGYGGWNESIGFGLNTVAVSNSYIQMLQWYGIWAFIGMTGVVVGGIRCILGERTTAQILVLTFLAMWCVVTGVEVVLEGPYMSAVIWCLIGFCYYYPDWQRIRSGREVSNGEG